jgi:hypothetical protein
MLAVLVELRKLAPVDRFGLSIIRDPSISSGLFLCD